MDPLDNRNMPGKQLLKCFLHVCVFVCLIVGEFGEAHEFSLYFMLPFIGVSLALLLLNW